MSESKEEYRQSRFTPPPGACEILLVRHGESAPAVAGESFPLVDGQSDPPLHPDGEEQARLVGDRLIRSGERFAAIYVTPLQRTAQTARPLLDALDMEPIVEPDLREVFLGDWEGGEFRKRAAERDPIIIEMWTQQRWDIVPGGEPQDDFRARVHRSIERIAETHPDQTVAVFSHGGVIGEIVRHAAGAERGFVFTGADNASISHVVVMPYGRWAVRCFNDTSHLGPGYSATAEPLT